MSGIFADGIREAKKIVFFEEGWESHWAGTIYIFAGLFLKMFNVKKNVVFVQSSVKCV